MKKVLISIFRFYANLRRNSKSKSTHLMISRGETRESYSIRELTEKDIPQLASVHAKAWADTYFLNKNPPTAETRNWQWKDLFAKNDGSWFCYVAVDKCDTIIGFAKGNIRNDADRAAATETSAYGGELNKIYLLFEYHRLGLGKLLLGFVARRFIRIGINNMLLFSEVPNPTAFFYEAMGAKKIKGKNGKFTGTYAWDNLDILAAL